MQLLKDKVALITGGSRGIGEAIVRQFAEMGCDVAFTYRSSGESAENMVKEASVAGRNVKAYKSDAANFDQAGELVKSVIEDFGKIDILINNAGIQFVSPIEDFPPEKWDQIIAINLTSAFHTIRAAVPGMKAREWGRIINTASAHSLVASPFKAAYVAAKHGIMGLTKTVALETAQSGITVNSISPGYVWTPLVANQIPDTMKARNLTRDQVINDVLLAAQPTRQFVTTEQLPLRLVPCLQHRKKALGQIKKIVLQYLGQVVHDQHPADLDWLLREHLSGRSVKDTLETIQR